jgi:hypothetical protein
MEELNCEGSQRFAQKIEAGAFSTIPSLFVCYGARTAPSSRLDPADHFSDHSTAPFCSLV